MSDQFQLGNPTGDACIEGTYYDGTSSRAHRARLCLAQAAVRIDLLDGPPVDPLTFEIGQMKVGSRLGNTPRTIRFENGAMFETRDNAAVDALESRFSRSGLRLHGLESRLSLAVAALVSVVVVSGAAYLWGIPFAARKVAQAIPQDIAFQMGQGTLETLDKILFEKSELSYERKQELRTGFADMAREYPRLPLVLEFRKASMPNAFALPDGTVVLTDELVEIVDGDDEIYAVLAHEIGHVEHRHSARLALESSAVALIVMVLFGDASQIAGITASLPAVYANSSYSRDHETEADTFALQYMRETGQDPEAFARALEHLTEAVPGSKNEGDALRYLASHPAATSRIARFRSASTRR